MGYKDYGSEESVEDSEDVAFEFGRAGEHYTQCEGDKGEVGGDWVANIEDKAVGEDCEERGKAFDGVNKGDRDFRCGG